MVDLGRPSEGLLRAASGFDRRSRIGERVALLLDLSAERFDLIGVNLKCLGSRGPLRDCRKRASSACKK